MSQVNDYSNYQNALQRIQDSYDSERTDSRTSNDKQLERAKKENEERLAAAKKDYNQRLENEKAQARDEIQRLKDELYDSSGKQSTQIAKDAAQERKDFAEYREETKKDADERVGIANERTEQQANLWKNSQDNKVEDAVRMQRKSDDQQITQLREELNQYRSSGRDVSNERAVAKQQAIAETEKGYTDDQKRIIESYERQIASLKDHEEAMGDHYNRQLSSAMIDANQVAQTQVKNQRDEFSKVERDNALDRNNLERSYQTQIDNLKSHEVVASNNLLEQNQKTTERAIANKDQTYQTYIGAKDQRYKQDVKDRDARIQDLATTDDPLKVSPFLVKKINDSAEQRNALALSEAQSVHQKNLTAEKDRDQAERQDMFRKNQDELTSVHRNSRKELDMRNRQLGDSYQNLQSSRQDELTNLTEKNRLNSERLYQKHAMDLEVAQKTKQEALLDQREVLTYDKNATVDEAEQLRRNQDRDWFLKTNDLRRGYESKIAEVMDQHDKQTQEMRLEFDKKLREQNRLSKREVDDRVRSYEHMITQQELSFKEKERFLTERYEGQLDTMKRTNAHLTEKKS